MKAIHDQADPQVKAILSPTQYEQWKSIRKEEAEQAVAEALSDGSAQDVRQWPQKNLARNEGD